MASTSSSPSSRRPIRTPGKNTIASPPLAHFVVGVVDRSGSMASMGNAPPEQMRAQMLELKAEAEKSGVSTHMTITTFDNTVETFMDNVKLENNDSLPTYADFQRGLQPRGTTRFYDTVYEALDALEMTRDAYLAALPYLVKRLSPTVVCSIMVLTDGADNSSTKHNRASVAARMTLARANGVNAIFLAANIDAGAEGSALGFAKQATVQMDSSYAGASQVMRAVSAGLRQASCGADDVDYNQMANQGRADKGSGRSGASNPHPVMPPMPILRRY